MKDESVAAYGAETPFSLSHAACTRCYLKMIVGGIAAPVVLIVATAVTFSREFKCFVPTTFCPLCNQSLGLGALWSDACDDEVEVSGQ